MKILIIFLININAFATTLDCESLNALQIPNCTHEEYMSSAENGDLASFCNCKTEFEKKKNLFPGLKIDMPTLDTKTILLNELKKSISANLLDLTTLRSVYHSPGDYSELETSCALKQIDDLKCLNDKDRASFKSEVQQELFRLLDSNQIITDDGILKRKENIKSCPQNISDSEILQMNALVIEDEIGKNPEMIKNFSAMVDPTEEKIIDILTKNNLLASFRHHPLYASLLSRPQDLKLFFKNIKNPIQTSEITKSLYSDLKNNQMMINGISDRCQKSFKTITKNLCSPSVLLNNVSIASFSLPNPYSKQSYAGAQEYINTSNPDEAIKRMENLNDALKVCSFKKTKDSLDLNKTLNDISGWMIDKDKNSNFQKYSFDRYTDQIGSYRDQICSALLKNQTPPCNSSQSKKECEIVTRFWNLKDKSKPEYQLANSSDSEINKVLRSMIGNPKASDLTPETAKVLIAQGIIPATENGALVETAQINRSPGKDFGQPVSTESTSTQAQTAQPARTNTKSVAAASARRSTNDQQVTGYTAPASIPSAQAESSELMDNIASEMRDQQTNRNLRGIADDIVANAKTKQQSSTQKQIKQSPSQVQSDISASTTNSQTSVAAAQQVSSATQSSADTSVALPGGPNDRKQELSNARMQAALESMAAKSGSAAALSNAGRATASTDIRKESDGTLAITVDPNSDVSQALASQLTGNGPAAAEMRELIAKGRSFSFQLNGNPVNVEFKNDRYSVASTSQISDLTRSKIENFLNNVRERASKLDTLKSMFNKN